MEIFLIIEKVIYEYVHKNRINWIDINVIDLVPLVCISEYFFLTIIIAGYEVLPIRKKDEQKILSMRSMQHDGIMQWLLNYLVTLPVSIR